MNGKFILVLMICFNIVGLLITAGYQDVNTNSEVNFGNNYIFNMFFDDVNISSIKGDQGISFNDEAEDAVASASEGKEGGVLEGITNFILSGWDVVKMVAGFLLILTPFPILAFFGSLGLPMWIMLIISAPIALVYILAIAEFVRGAPF